MPVYQYVCDACGFTMEHVLPVDKRNDPEQDCLKCKQGTMKKTIGNSGGFRLGRNGTVGWADEGYGSTHGDIENFKAGRKVYKD